MPRTAGDHRADLLGLRGLRLLGHPTATAVPGGLRVVQDNPVIVVVAVLSGLAGFMGGLIVGVLLIRRRTSARHRGQYPWK